MATLLGTATLNTSFSAECFDSHIAHRDNTRTQSTDTRLPIYAAERPIGSSAFESIGSLFAAQNFYQTENILLSTNVNWAFAFDLLDIHPDATINSVTLNIRARVSSGTRSVNFGFGVFNATATSNSVTIDTTLTTHTMTITGINKTLNSYNASVGAAHGVWFNLNSAGLDIAQISASVNYTGKTLRKTEIKIKPISGAMNIDVEFASDTDQDIGVRATGWNWANIITDDDDFEIKNIVTTYNVFNAHLRELNQALGIFPNAVWSSHSSQSELLYLSDEGSTYDANDTIDTIDGKGLVPTDLSPTFLLDQTIQNNLYSEFTDWDEYAINKKHPVYYWYPNAVPHQNTEDLGIIQFNIGSEIMWQDIDTNITAQDLRNTNYTLRFRQHFGQPTGVGPGYGGAGGDRVAGITGGSSDYPRTYSGGDPVPHEESDNLYFNPNGTGVDTSLLTDETRGFREATLASQLGGPLFVSGLFRQGIGFELGPRGIVAASSAFDLTTSAQPIRTTTAPLNISATATTLGGFIVTGSLDFGKYLADDYVATDYIREDSQGAVSDFDIGLAGMIFAGVSTMASAMSTSMTAELAIRGGVESAFATTMTVSANNTLRAQADIDFDTNITALGGFDIEGTATPQAQFAVSDLDNDDVLIIRKPQDSHVFTTATETRTYVIPEDLRTETIAQQTRTHTIPIQGEDRAHQRHTTVPSQTRTVKTEGM
tara:strand:- start:2133 stop:4268 length:2136 start_codon:yes stop_codon:yes gene_type:complete